MGGYPQDGETPRPRKEIEMKKAITQEAVDQVLARRAAGTPASKIPGELGVPSSTVNVILSANGLTKAREDVRERDAKRLANWLAAGAQVEDAGAQEPAEAPEKAPEAAPKPKQRKRSRKAA